MNTVCIPESDLKFLFIWCYLSMPIVLWFLVKAAKGFGSLAFVLLAMWGAVTDGKKSRRT